MNLSSASLDPLVQAPSGVRSFGESLHSLINSLASLSNGGSNANAMEIDDSVVRGLDTVYIKDYSTLCCGAVGSGSQSNVMCTSTSTSCTIGAHKTCKCTHSNGPAIYHKKFTSNRVFLEPAFVVDEDLSNEESQTILSTKYAVDSWAELVHTRDLALNQGVTMKAATELIETQKYSIPDS